MVKFKTISPPAPVPPAPVVPAVVVTPVTYKDNPGLPDVMPGIRPLTEEEFAKSWFWTYAFDAGGCANVPALPGMLDRFGGYMTRAFHRKHDNTGILMFNDYWAGKEVYFAYGCVHEYRELGGTECRARNIFHGGNCYHVSECKLCGHINSVDSSD